MRIDLGAGSLLGDTSGLTRAQLDRGMRTILARIGGMPMTQPNEERPNEPVQAQ